jgi:hypothetical protein
MPLLYVTGLAATGKSAILAELLARGYRAFGVDEDGYADWISQETGEPEPMPALADLDFPTWYKTHYWVLSRPRITELSHQAAELGEPVFLCGTAAGDREAWHLFSQVIALVADLATLRQRIEAMAPRSPTPPAPCTKSSTTSWRLRPPRVSGVKT